MYQQQQSASNMYPLLGTTIRETDSDIFDNMPFKKMRRSIKNFAYSDIEKKVRKATNNDPWGPSSLLMSEIAVATKESTNFQQIMHLIWERLGEDQKQWRHIYKTLYLLEYLIKAGDEKVTKSCIENLYKLNQLKQISHIEVAEYDRGKSIKEKAESIIFLLRDKETLEMERQKIEKTRIRCIGESSNMGSSSTSTTPTTPISSSTFGSPNNKRIRWREEWKKKKNAEKAIEATEKFGQENALQLALALSEKEMEEVEHIVEQEEEMLRVAIEESKRLARIPIDMISEPERPFSPPPIFSSSLFEHHQQQQESTPKAANVMEEITKEIMALDFSQPTSSGIPVSPQRLPSFNDSFYKSACTPTLSSPSSKNLPDLTAAAAGDPFEVAPLTPITQSMTSPLPEFPITPSSNPFMNDIFSNNGHPTNNISFNDIFSNNGATNNPFLDDINSKNGHAHLPSNNILPSTPTPIDDIFTTSLNQQHTVPQPAHGCSSSEAYQRMEAAFRSFKLTTTTSNNLLSPSLPDFQLSSNNPFLNDVINSNNGQQCFNNNNPFI